MCVCVRVYTMTYAMHEGKLSVPSGVSWQHRKFHLNFFAHCFPCVLLAIAYIQTHTHTHTRNRAVCIQTDSIYTCICTHRTVWFCMVRWRSLPNDGFVIFLGQQWVWTQTHSCAIIFDGMDFTHCSHYSQAQLAMVLRCVYVCVCVCSFESSIYGKKSIKYSGL